MIKLKFSSNAAVKKIHGFHFLPVFMMPDMGSITALQLGMMNIKD
jgi:hypothetical protein